MTGEIARFFMINPMLLINPVDIMPEFLGFLGLTRGYI
ncbi:DUF1232 domain-containing protein [Thermanaerosceptrum fracticalcis]|nr:DUF1232 domain-containing protein [Thermanaerosceptrum fracticalcis]